MAMRKSCQAVLGRMSHLDWKQKSWGSPQMRVRFGYRVRSARIKKDGYFGRKIRPPPPIKMLASSSRVFSQLYT